MRLREALARRAAAVPLRVGLVIALLALSAAALFASGAAVTSALSRSLTARVDEQLKDAARSWAKPRKMTQIVTEDGRTSWVPADLPNPPVVGISLEEQPRRFYELRKNAAGEVMQQLPGADGTTPDLTSTPEGLTVTVNSADGAATRWRVLTTANQYGSTTIGMPLTENSDIVSRLIYFEIGTGLTTLGALGVFGYLVIRRSLRPLREVERTAAAIAGGDLHRRLPVRDIDTEVDHLARSLNEMLAQIQRGVAATEASEEAARQSEAKMRRFVADASHELRTPLTTIRGFAELYRQGASTDAGMLLRRIECEAGRMGLLVEDLLMLARLDANRPLERELVDLLALASDAVDSTRAMAAPQPRKSSVPARSISLELVRGVGTLDVVGDSARLRQVLSNLLGNALTHTPADSAITVRLTPCPEEVWIEVIDAGPGLSADAAARVFERFYRTDDSRTRASGGTGLGLSIVHALVTAHGGHVGVTSELGQGATFTVNLPRGLA
ncbi:two-component system, OmpR family, sensor kinase [Nocardia amikacinitolerans]|nr:two-component system, OmpR family, sensor kinase [Nocardia amikacinitolerans]